jgi:para-nitrobenzyl esterase
MAWLHGGGNHTRSGEGSADFGGVGYNEQLVPQGVVFVSVNSRLGVLGFLSHAALSAEHPEKISGNYGSLDQIAVLQWIKRNIAAFGGDPSHVFLFGTSAGWPAQSGNDVYFEFDANAVAKTGPTAANCDFWDGVPMLWPHL